MIKARLKNENDIDSGVEFFIECDFCEKEIELINKNHNIEIKHGEQELLFLHCTCSMKMGGINEQHKRSWTKLNGEKIKTLLREIAVSPDMLFGAFFEQKEENN